MQKVLFILLIVWLVALECPAMASTGPKVYLPQASDAYGKTFLDRDKFFTFEIHNVGDETLTLEVIKNSCQFAKASLSANVVDPGGMAFIRLGYAAGSVAVPVDLSYRAVLVTNDPTQPELSFFAEISVRALIDVEPSSIECGLVSRGQKVTHELKITLGDPGLQFQVKTDPHGPVLVEQDESEPVADGEERLLRYRVTLDTARAPRHLSTFITLVPHLQDVSSVDIPVSCEIDSPVMARPERLLLGSLKAGDSCERSVELFHNADAGLLHTECSSSALKAALEQGSSPDRSMLHVVTEWQSPAATWPAWVYILNEQGHTLEVVEVTAVPFSNGP